MSGEVEIDTFYVLLKTLFISNDFLWNFSANIRIKIPFNEIFLIDPSNATWRLGDGHGSDQTSLL